MKSSTVYFWLKVWDVTKVILCIVLALAAVIGIVSLFDAAPAFKKMDITYSVGSLGDDGLPSDEDSKNTLVSEFIHATAFYTIHQNVNKVSDYTIWFYDANKNYISNASYNMGTDPADYREQKLKAGDNTKYSVMPLRTDAEGNVYVDRNDKPVAAEYIRITLRPQAEIVFDNWFTDWIYASFVYKDVLVVKGTVREQVFDMTGKTTVPLYPVDSEATEPAA